MPGYRLTKSAKADLQNIVRYTKREWGKAQTVRYTNRLLQGLEQIAAGTGQFKDMSDLAHGLRMARCERHYLVCLELPDQQPAIVAILHERMDLMARIAERLG